MTQPNREPKSAESAQATTNEIVWPLHILFDGPPSHESGRFVEVNDDTGKSVRAGEWIEKDGFWELVIQARPETEHVEPEGEVDALVAEARASTVDACVAYFRREFSTDPDAHTLAAIREAEANAPLTVVFTDDDLAALRREVWAGLPIAIPDGTVTPDGPPPTDDMVIEQGRRRRIWDGYRTHPGTVLALLNTIDRLASALSSRRALSREEVGALIEPDLQWAVGGPCYDWPAHQAGRERALSKADAILSRVEGK